MKKVGFIILCIVQITIFGYYLFSANIFVLPKYLKCTQNLLPKYDCKNITKANIKKRCRCLDIRHCYILQKRYFIILCIIKTTINLACVYFQPIYFTKMA